MAAFLAPLEAFFADPEAFLAAFLVLRFSILSLFISRFFVRSFFRAACFSTFSFFRASRFSTFSFFRASRFSAFSFFRASRFSAFSLFRACRFSAFSLFISKASRFSAFSLFISKACRFSAFSLFILLIFSTSSLFILIFLVSLLPNSFKFESGSKSFSNSGVGGAAGVGCVFFVTTVVAELIVAMRLVAPWRFFTSTAPRLRTTVEAPLRETNKSNFVPLTPIVAVGVRI